MQISFYVLGERYLNDNAAASSTASAANAEAVLNFVCRLTQTVLQKSEHSLVIVDDQVERLKQLDTQLWSFDPVSFVAHDFILQEAAVSQLSAPVSLVSTLPGGFDGVILNLAATPLPLSVETTAAVLPERVLEIITPDEAGKQLGRDKYRAYQQLGFELNYFPINK
ncbi:DNA polymerase III subunit chi [Psychrobacter raelei]|uniref:DNA polymerase III subunit chi n=1 Tax=Psychrobacter raelei TaxID=2565531 RepID=A0AAT9PE49_9GAMM